MECKSEQPAIVKFGIQYAAVLRAAGDGRNLFLLGILQQMEAEEETESKTKLLGRQVTDAGGSLLSPTMIGSSMLWAHLRRCHVVLTSCYAVFCSLLGAQLQSCDLTMMSRCP